MLNSYEIIEQLYKEHDVSKEEIIHLLEEKNPQVLQTLYKKAARVREEHYGTDVYIRGLIEFSNYCKNNCFYCGIRRDNGKLCRYRLSKEQIYDCVDKGYKLGYRTFVLQSGEDVFYGVAGILEIIKQIKSMYPDCAITLSLGEYDYDTYKAWFEAGADRYLLRHETITKNHYDKLHPSEMSYENRIKCLYNLKEIGYQVGAGFMVGSPFQTLDMIADDILFLNEFRPHMIGIGPFISQKDTPFADKTNGTMELTLKCLAILRLLLPKVLLPATTALGTIAYDGREQGLKAGANVLMPNLSPKEVRDKYALYDNKICTGEEAAECRECLDRRVENIGYHIITHRGDSLM